MPPENNIAFSTDSDEQGFADAVSLFAKDDTPQATPQTPQPTPHPAPTPPPQVPEEPEPDEPEKVVPDDEPINIDTAAKTEPEKLEEEFIEFTGKQKERFNSVYGALKRLERENADYQRRLQQFQQQPQYQPQPAVPQPQFQPQQVSEPRPLLENFATADEWGNALTNWTKQQVLSEVRVETARERGLRQQEELVQQQHNYINGRIAEGQKKVGMKQFNEAAKDIVQFAPHGSTMYAELFELERFPEVVVHLSKNLELADHISSLRQKEQIVELRLLERKLALAAKQPPKLPTKVEAPGNGQDQKSPISAPKLRAAAKASGDLKDWAKVFQADPTM